MGRAAVGPSYRSSCWLGFYHQYQYGTQIPPRHRRPRRRRRPPRYLRPRYLRPASAGALVAALIAVARVVTPTVVPMVPTALMHQNSAIAMAATVWANSFPGDKRRLLIPLVLLSFAFQEAANLEFETNSLTGLGRLGEAE